MPRIGRGPVHGGRVNQLMDLDLSARPRLYEVPAGPKDRGQVNADLMR